ncbi:MAG: hypothetical protein HYV04_19645 [Deltaproteobacteria bacterium]|nr:hypothetical protein [Deltaproteobacteria bacterium]
MRWELPWKATIVPCAMAGAISGAHLGLETVPLDLARCLTDQGTWGFDQLLELADRAYAVKMRLAHTS